MKKNISISIDDGHPLDIRAAEILANKGIPTTFYIPIKNSTGRPTLNKKQIKYLSQNLLFEIGGHTYNHIDVTKVSIDKAKEEIKTGKEALEDIIGKKITSFAWPFGRYNHQLITLIKNIGFENSRSAVFINFNQLKTDSLWNPNLHIYPHSFIRDIKHCLKKSDIYSFFIRLKNIKKTHIELVNVFKNTNKNYHFWFHSWEIDELNLWGIIKSL